MLSRFFSQSETLVTTELVVTSALTRLAKHPAYGSLAPVIADALPFEVLGPRHELFCRFIFFGPPDKDGTLVWCQPFKTFVSADHIFRGYPFQEVLRSEDDRKLEPELCIARGWADRGKHRHCVYRVYLRNGEHKKRMTERASRALPERSFVLSYFPVTLLTDPYSLPAAEHAVLFDLRRVANEADPYEDEFGEGHLFYSEGGDDGSAYKVFEDDIFKFKVLRRGEP